MKHLQPGVLTLVLVSIAAYGVMPQGAHSQSSSSTAEPAPAPMRVDEGLQIQPGMGSPVRIAPSSSQTVIIRGLAGVKDANVFVPKYKERLQTYGEQIQMGLTKGWLTQEQADHFSSELERLRKLDEAASAQQYAPPVLDNLDKEFTQFNIEFSRAASGAPAKPAGSAESATASPTNASETNTTPGKTTPDRTAVGAKPVETAGSRAPVAAPRKINANQMQQTAPSIRSTEPYAQQ